MENVFMLFMIATIIVVAIFIIIDIINIWLND